MALLQEVEGLPTRRLMLETCVRLVHATPSRRRYRIDSATPVDWDRLSAELHNLIRSDHLEIRLNRSSRSVVFTLSDPEAIDLLVDAWQALYTAADRAGATPKEPEVIKVRVGVVRPSPFGWLRRLALPLNMASLGASLGLVFLAGLATLLGVLGLMLPLAPGAPLLLVAYLLLELAFTLRRPFVRTVAA